MICNVEPTKGNVIGNVKPTKGNAIVNVELKNRITLDNVELPCNDTRGERPRLLHVPKVISDVQSFIYNVCLHIDKKLELNLLGGPCYFFARNGFALRNCLKIMMKVHKEKLMNFDSSIFVDTVYANQSSLNATR